MDFVVLAGGLGKRLRTVVNDVPKPMADIGGTPFLELLIREILFSDPERIIICVSYKKEVIQKYFGDNFLGTPIFYSEEETPLDTGGAIRKAFRIFEIEEAIVLNGDTFVRLNFDQFIAESKDEKFAMVDRKSVV